MFERFRRSSTAEPGRFSCYGKLPFDREFLRYQLDSEEGRWIVDWVDGAHQVIVERGASIPPESPVELRVILARGGGKSAVAALVRPSRDGGKRSYPVCTFSVLDARALRERWHLAPLWVAPLWETMDRRLLDGAIPDRKAFAAVLGEASGTPESLDTAAARFDDAARERVDAPWRALSGASPETARNLALTLVQLGAAHAASRSASDGAALRFPLTASSPTQTAAWIRLFSAVSDSAGPWPAVVEAHERGSAKPKAGCIFGREPTPEDLAYLLAGVGDPAIDDLNQTWDRELSSERAEKALAGLLDENARCLADLWEKS
jgi:type VI secretion system ImpM family protein